MTGLSENRVRKTLSVLTALGIALYALFLVWVLWLKLGNVSELQIIRQNVSNLDEKERWLVDTFLFKDPRVLFRQIAEIVLYCFVLAPFGVALTLLTRGKHIWAHVLFCFSFSLCIELLQRVTLIGGFSFIDLFTNTLGYFVGLLLYKLIFSRLSDKALIGIIGTVILMLSAALAYATFSIIEIKDLLMALFQEL